MTGALAVRLGDEVGIDLAAVGALYGVIFGSSAIASTPTGHFVQRIGWEAGIRLAAGGAGLSLLAMALLPTGAWSDWWPVAAIFAVAGVAAAVSQAASNLALAVSVPPARYGLLFGLKHTAVPAAAMLGGLAVPTVALTLGWRQAYAAAALLAFLTAAAVPRHGERPIASGLPRKRVRPTTPVAVLAALAVAAALAHTGLDALGAFIVSYAVSEGVAEGSAGLLLTVASLVGLTARLGTGWGADSRPHSGLAWIAALLVTGSVGFVALAAGGRPLLLLGTLLAFAGGWGWAGLLTFVVVRANPDTAAVATGIANTGKYVGAGLGPFTLGHVAENVSFAAAWVVAGAVMFAAAIIVAIIRLTPSGRAMADPPSPA